MAVVDKVIIITIDMMEIYLSYEVPVWILTDVGLCVFFQSLDYDNIENQLFLEEERRMSYMVNNVGINQFKTHK